MGGSWPSSALISGDVNFGHTFDLHVTVLEQPLVILLEQHSADQPDDAGLVGEDADDIGPPLDLLVEPFQRIGAVQLGAVLGREGRCRRARRARCRPSRRRAWASAARN